MSPRTTSAPAASRRPASELGRTRARTCLPRASSASTALPPSAPVPPTTRTGPVFSVISAVFTVRARESPPGCEDERVNRRLGWAIVGTGGISRTTAGDLHLTENLDLVAVASRTIENASAFAEEFEVPRAYGDYDALLEDDAVEVVYIGTPIATHAELARRALRAGKHVLVEKAFTTTADDARGLAALAAREGRFLMEAMWMRFNPAFRRMLDEVEKGAIGEVRTVHAGFGIPFPEDWNIWRPELGGGALLDMGVYPLTLAHLMLGRPESVMATGELRDDGLDVTASVYLRHGEGRFAQALT